MVRIREDVGVLRLIGSLLPEEGIDEMGLGCKGGFDGGVKFMALTLCVLFGVCLDHQF